MSASSADPATASPQPPPGPAPAADSSAAPRAGWLATLLLAAVSVALYLPSVHYPFVYDDLFLVQNNIYMAAVDERGLPATFAFFGLEYWDGTNQDRPEPLRMAGQALYRPLTLWTWSLVRWVNGLTPTWPYHAVNVALNACVVLLLHLVLLRLFGSRWLAFAAALLFATHPLHVEAVTYVAGLSDLLAAASIFLGLLLWERATRDPAGVRTGPWLGLLAVFFVGLLAKEQAALLPAVILLTDLTCSVSGRRRLSGATRALVYGGLLVTLALHVLVRAATLPNLKPDSSAISGLDNPLIREAFDIRLINGVKLIVMQLWLVLFPKDLSIDYSFHAIPVSRSWTDPEPLAAGVLLALLLAWGLFMLRRRPALGWGALFFVGTAIYTSNILVPIGTIFGERLAYLPSAGVAVAVAGVIGALCGVLRPGGVAGPPDRRRAALGLVLVAGAAVPLGWRTVERSHDFRDSLTLFESAAQVVPMSGRVHYQLGTLWAQQQLWTAAEDSFARALAIDQSMLHAAIGLGDVYNASKNYAKAIETYDVILRQVRGTSGSDAGLAQVEGMVLLRRGGARAGIGDVEGASADLQAATRSSGTETDTITAYLALARLNIDRGRPADAIPPLRTALSLAPRNEGLLYELARAASQLKDAEALRQAIEGLKQTTNGRTLALALEAEQLYGEGVTTGNESLRQQALAQFDEVRAAAAHLATPYIYRALFLADRDRPRDALSELELALDRAPNHPGALLAKAQAQLALGNSEAALTTARQRARLVSDSPGTLVLFAAAAGAADLDEMERAFQRLQELGTAPMDAVVERARALRDAGRLDEALAAIEVTRLLPAHRDDPNLLRNLGVLLLDSGRFDEALAAFAEQELAESLLLDEEGQPVSDPFLPINRARVLMGLGRTLEAAAQLELFERDVPTDSPAVVSLLHRRAELFLLPGPLFDPARATALADEGLLRVRNAYPPLLEVAVEAALANGDLPGALQRLGVARMLYPAQERFATADAALGLASQAGRAEAMAALRADGEPWLLRLALRLSDSP